MQRTTFSIPQKLKAKIDSRSDINWPEVFKQGIEQKLEQLENLKKKGDL